MMQGNEAPLLLLQGARAWGGEAGQVGWMAGTLGLAKFKFGNRRHGMLVSIFSQIKKTKGLSVG